MISRHEILEAEKAQPPTTEAVPVAREQQFQYDLFISYATSPDYRLAQRLEAFLEGFHKLPTIEGKALRRLNICMDGSDFSRPRGCADESVDAIISRHLNQAAELLVVCSRNAMLSPYVNAEVSWFLENRGPAAIRLAVSEGFDPANQPADIFSQTILSTGLIKSPWYDLRQARGKDAANWVKVRDFDMERVRLAADLLGRKASELQPLWFHEQRRAARLRFYWATAISLVLLALAVVAIWFAVIADDRRKKEQAARGDAEKLIEFLRTEVRATLEPLGRLDLMEGINTQVHSYYERNDADGGKYNRLIVRSEEKYQDGELLLNLGKQAAAEKAYDEAAQLAKLAGQGNKRSEWQIAAARAVSRVGDLAVLQGNKARYPEAKACYIEALGLIDTLRKNVADPEAGLSIWSATRAGLAFLDKLQGSLETAAATYQTIADTLSAKANQPKPDAVVVDNFIMTLLHLCGCQREMKKKEEAMTTAQRAANMAKRAFAGAMTPRFRELVARSYFQMAAVAEEFEDRKAAEHNYARAASLIMENLTTEPRNGQWQAFAVDCFHCLGNVLCRGGNFAGGLREFRNGLTHAEAFRQSDPTNVDALLKVATACRDLASGLDAEATADGKPIPKEARDLLSRARALMTQVETKDPGNEDAQHLNKSIAELQPN